MGLIATARRTVNNEPARKHTYLDIVISFSSSTRLSARSWDHGAASFGVLLPLFPCGTLWYPFLWRYLPNAHHIKEVLHAADDRVTGNIDFLPACKAAASQGVL